MKNARILLVASVLPLGGCFYNPTIDQEVADKCDISVATYQQTDAALDKGYDGMSLRAGRCQFTRTSKGVFDVAVLGK